MTEIVKASDKLARVSGLLERARPAITQALVSHMTPDRFLRIVLTCVRSNPRLLDADPASLIGAVLECAQVGLVPDSVLGEAYIVPFKDNKRGTYVATLMPGYRGVATLACRSGEVATLHHEAVWSCDEFDYCRGTEWPDGFMLRHRPKLDRPREATLIAAYAMAVMKGGAKRVAVIGPADAKRAKSMSQAGRRDEGPWATDPAPMWAKTAVLRLGKLLPLSPEDRRVMEREEALAVSDPRLVTLDSAREIAEGIVASTDQAVAGHTPSRLDAAAVALKAREAKPAEPEEDEWPEDEPEDDAPAEPGKDEARDTMDGIRREAAIKTVCGALARMSDTAREAAMRNLGIVDSKDLDEWTTEGLEEAATELAPRRGRPRG